MRRPTVAVLATLALVALAAPRAPQARTYATTTTSANRVAATYTNYGVIGNNFANRGPSLAYPEEASGYEHLVVAGLWVGGVRPESSFTGVTTAALETGAGLSTPNLTEFGPVGDRVERRSSLANSVYYSPDAVSELDLIAEFDDLSPAAPAYATEPHRPLGVKVTQYVYHWGFFEWVNIAFVRYVVHNVGGSPLLNAWVGLFADLASGNKGASTFWPPSGWFGKSWLVYDPANRVLREHYCSAKPVPANCNLAAVPFWAGIQLLTPPAAGQRWTVAGLNFSLDNPSRNTDAGRYALMSSGEVSDFAADSLRPGTGDPVEVLALGPFASIAAGDSVTVDFALLGGAAPESIAAYAAAAQTLRDVNFDGHTVPAQSALVAADAWPDHVHLRWSATADPGTTVRIERASAAAPRDWRLLADVAPGPSGLVEYTDRDVAPGDRWGWRIVTREGGAAFTSAGTWLDVPAVPAFALRGVSPSPARAGAASVRWALPDASPAALECFDLLGRREALRAVGGEGAGEHVLPLSALGALRPGIHLLRLSQAGRVARVRVVILP